jgi:hypothetical protein
VGVPDRFEFAFGCSAGHVVGLEALFLHHPETLRAYVGILIATWERSITQMAEGTQVAVRFGAERLAHRLRRRATILEGKVHLFRETFLSDANRTRG